MMTLLVQKRNDEKDNQDILTLKRKNPVKLTQLPKFMCKFLTSLCAVTCWSVMMYYCDVMYCRSVSLQQATERHDVLLMLCIVDLRHCSKLQNVMMYPVQLADILSDTFRPLIESAINVSTELDEIVAGQAVKGCVHL